MATNHALFFIFDGPREGKESQGMENFQATRAFWSARKAAGDIDSFETVMLASTGNQSMPSGFLLVTGDREKLHRIRWSDEAFLKIHTVAMTSMNGYACIDGYAGAGFDAHMKRLLEVLKP